MPRTNAYPTLTRGDLLLTKGSFDTGTHAVINIGQAIFSHSRHGNYDFCHAAIYVGRGVRGATRTSWRKRSAAGCR